MSAPLVYSAITAVAAELGRSGLAKSQTNAPEQYRFRGIDDLYDRLSPALAAHRLCILPRVLEREASERTSLDGSLLISVSVKVAYDLVSAEDGSVHVIEAYGEALDGGDKATSKAVTAAFKYALFQAFCIPVTGSEDADSSTYRLKRTNVAEEPVQGWEQWVLDIADVVRVCESHAALDRLHTTNRDIMRLLSTRRLDLYVALGETIRDRRKALTDRVVPKHESPVRGESDRVAPSRPMKAQPGPGLPIPPARKRRGAGKPNGKAQTDV